MYVATPILNTYNNPPRPNNKQGAVVKQLKKDGAKPETLEPEVAKLVQLRAELEAARKAQTDGNADGGAPFNRAGGCLGLGWMGGWMDGLIG